MNAIIETINSAGRAFVEFALPMFIQSSVLILILLVVDVVLRRRVRAVFRYGIWMLVLLKLVLPPSLGSPISIGAWLGDKLEPPAIAFSEAPAPQHEPLPSGWQPQAKLGDGTPVAPNRVQEVHAPTPSVAAASDSVPMDVSQPGQTIAPESAPDGTTSVQDATRQPVPALRWQALVLLAWMAVALALLLLLFQRACFVCGLAAQAQEAPPELTTALSQCRTRMGMSRPIAVRVSHNATSPAVCGLLRPVILIPQSLAPRLQPHDLQAVMLHELAHIKRGDLWVNLVQTLLQIAYFYNPFLWLANVVIRRVREQAVDEAVLVAMGETARDYPETLLNVAKLAFHRHPALSLRLIGVVESKSALRSRIKHILNRPLPKTARLGLLGLVVVFLIAAIFLPMAKARPMTDRARNVMSLADEEARRLNHSYIGTEHILLALARQEAAVSAKVLANLGTDLDTLRAEVNRFVRPGPEPVTERRLLLTPRAQRVMQYAREEAKALGHDYIGTEHILLALLRDKDGVAAQVLAALGITETQIRAQVLTFVQSTAQDSGDSGDEDAGGGVLVGPRAGEPSGVVAELPNGVTVEFVAYSHLNTDGLRWYTPEGKSTTIPGVYEADVEGHGVILAVRADPTPQAGVFAWSFQPPDIKYELKPVWRIGDSDIWLVPLGEGRSYVNVELTAQVRDPVIAKVITRGPSSSPGPFEVAPWGIGQITDVKRVDSDNTAFTMDGSAAGPIAPMGPDVVAALDTSGRAHSLRCLRGDGLEAIYSEGRGLMRYETDIPVDRFAGIVVVGYSERAASMQLRNVSLRPGQPTKVRVEVAPEQQGPWWHRSDYSSDLEHLGEVLSQYADESGGRYPVDLSVVRVLFTDTQWEWLQEHVVYLGASASSADGGIVPLAYEKKLLRFGFGTYVLFRDGSVSFRVPDELEKLGVVGANRAGLPAQLLDPQTSGVAADAPVEPGLSDARGIASGQDAGADVWKEVGEAIPPDANDARTLAPGVVLDGIGQDVEGKVFVSCVRDVAATGEMQYRLVLHRKDGQVLEPRYYASLERADGRLWEKFTFDMRYDHRQIDHFPLQVRRPDRDRGLGIPLARDEIIAAAGATEKPSPSREGPPGRYALSFDGRGDYLFIPDSESLHLPQQFTIELWIKPQFPEGSLENRPGWAVLAKGAYTGTGRVRVQGFGIKMNDADRATQTVIFDHSVASLNDRGYASAGTGERFSQDWIHVSETFQRDRFIPAPGHPLVIGRFLIPSEDPFMGQIAEIRIWDGAKSGYTGQYKDKALTGNEPGLLACWTFEEGRGQIAHDSSPHANHARLGSSVEADDADPTWLDLEAAQIATGQISGRVLDPDGEPVAGAQVAVCTEKIGVVIRNGRLELPRTSDMEKGQIVQTDAQGRFRFESEPNEGFSLVAAHEAGFGLIGSDEFTANGEIRLVLWGRIEGQVAEGRQALEGQIWMAGLPNETWLRDKREYRYEARCDAEGRFAFDKVPPGWFEVGYLTKTGDMFSSLTSRTPVVVKPGETATIQLGGEGRPVVGRFVPPAGYEGSVYFGAGSRALETQRPEPPRPEDYDQMTQREQQEWIKQWYGTPEAQAYSDTIWHDLNRRQYTFRIQKDGSFRIEDVIAGKYNLNVWLEERLGGQGRPEEIGGYYGTVEVPPMNEAYSDEPLDVGDLVLTMRPPLHVGDMAPLFEAETLDGRDIRLADYRGRFVLLCFWSPVFHPELDRLKELHEIYRDSGKLQIIGLGGTDTREEVKKYVEEHDIEWPEIYFGPDWDAELLRQLGGQMQIMLIDPEGKIVATWLRGQKLTDTVREAVEKADPGLSGRVIGPNGELVADAIVSIIAQSDTVKTESRLPNFPLVKDSDFPSIRTDAWGRFRFDMDPAEDFILMATHRKGTATMSRDEFLKSHTLWLTVPWLPPEESRIFVEGLLREDPIEIGQSALSQSN